MKNKKKFQFQLNKFVAIVFVACEMLCKKIREKRVEKRNRQRGDVCFMRHFMEAHNILHPFKVKRTEPGPIKYKMISNSQHFFSRAFTFTLLQIYWKRRRLLNFDSDWQGIKTFNEWTNAKEQPTNLAVSCSMIRALNNAEASWKIFVSCP